MRTRSLRFRLTVWYAAVLTAGLGLFGSLLWVSMRHELLSDLDRELEGRAKRFESYYRNESVTARHINNELEEFSQGLPPGAFIDLHGPREIAFRFPQGPPEPTVGFRIHRREFTIRGEKYQLEVGAPLGDVRHALDLLRFLLWGLIPVVIAIACVGGAWLAGRALKPVRAVTDAALTISIENLSERLPVPATGDEIAQLAGVLNSMLARLEAAVTTLSQFVADASHELRTPLTVIRTTAELALRRERSPESYKKALQEIAGESERMTQLIEDLLALARSDAGAVDMPRSAIDLREILAEVSVEMSGLAEALQVRVKTVFAEQAAVVSGNRPALHRLFMVLLDNALKYSHPGGEVILAMASKNGGISVSVEDFGKGIGEHDLPHIFKRFYQADRARNAGGHGLGLSLAQNIARAHGVEIGVRSTPGKGSTFVVVFPQRDTMVTTVKLVPDAEALAGY
jgi:two-component system heavy metal sensor histidine kinase CusS